MENVTKVSTPITELVRFSYLTLVEPKTAPGATEAKYSVSVIIPKDNKKTMGLIKNAIEAAEKLGRDKFGSKWAAKKKPIRDGDTEREDEAYANAWFFNASNKMLPGIVGPNPKVALQPKDIKSGDWGCVSVNFYPFNVNGNQGIGVSFNHIQFCKSGDALGSVTNAEDEFEAFEEQNSTDDNSWMS